MRPPRCPTAAPLAVLPENQAVERGRRPAVVAPPRAAAGGPVVGRRRVRRGRGLGRAVERPDGTRPLPPLAALGRCCCAGVAFHCDCYAADRR